MMNAREFSKLYESHSEALLALFADVDFVRELLEQGTARADVGGVSYWFVIGGEVAA